ncbi:MAG: Na+:solute symporter [Pirellulales bacterium]|nr:Na+:solute symporter [Pirellulales bacterium]
MGLFAIGAAEPRAAHGVALHGIDIGIIIGYVALVLALGWMLSKRASKNLDAYFLGDKSLPWWVIGTSHGASGFDITGTMWFVAMVFTYGVKAAFTPWIWPLFDRIFRQVYLGPWIRRSNVLTGAEWMQTRFGRGRSGNLSHISVVVYALVATVAFLAYAFEGIGKFAEVFFPWQLVAVEGPLSNADAYAILILALTTAYLLLGGWYSVVLTDLIQFALLTVASVCIAWLAMSHVTPEMLDAKVPAGWYDLLPGWKLDTDWSGLIGGLNTKIYGTAAQGGDGFSLFGVVVMMMLLRGFLVSMAGPTPGYGMQHQLSTRNAREAALENWWMSIVQLVPRSLMIAGIAVLGVVFFSEDINTMVAGSLAGGDKAAFDFEQVLPFVISRFVPVGLVGILMAGLLAAFMSTFDSTVNAGAAYLVNDVYKRYIQPNASPRRYVALAYAASILLVVVGIVVGFNIRSINAITKWITFALYSGYMAPNVLKWHWWRFNGYGYFCGMLGGIVAAVLSRWLLPDVELMYHMFLIFPVSLIASVGGCLLTPPDDRQVLRAFYRNVRPWGFWRPIREELQREVPGLKANGDFGIDMFNVVNGIVWQLMLMTAPICLVIRQWTTFWISVAVLAVTSVIMKFTWYDRLGSAEVDDAEAAPSGS